ncbi:MAG: hypothetical protein R3F27_07750 [Gammaproteobacteria bacterium]
MNFLNRRCLALPALALLLAAGSASAEKLVMPRGMGGVPDIGAIPCEVYNDMMRIGPLGTRHSLITWSAGYLNAVTGKSLQEVVNAADRTGPAWTYDRLGDELTAFCKANPKALTRDAVLSVARALE